MTAWARFSMCWRVAARFFSAASVSPTGAWPRTTSTTWAAVSGSGPRSTFSGMGSLHPLGTAGGVPHRVVLSGIPDSRVTLAPSAPMWRWLRETHPMWRSVRLTHRTPHWGAGLEVSGGREQRGSGAGPRLGGAAPAGDARRPGDRVGDRARSGSPPLDDLPP